MLCSCTVGAARCKALRGLGSVCDPWGWLFCPVPMTNLLLVLPTLEGGLRPQRAVQLWDGGLARLLVALCGRRDGAGDAGVVAGGHRGHSPRWCCSSLPSPGFGGAPVPPQAPPLSVLSGSHRPSHSAVGIPLPGVADPAAQLRFVLPRVQPNLSSSSVSLEPPPKAAGSWIAGRTGKEASHQLHATCPRKAILHHHLTPVLPAL